MNFEFLEQKEYDRIIDEAAKVISRLLKSEYVENHERLKGLVETAIIKMFGHSIEGDDSVYIILKISAQFKTEWFEDIIKQKKVIVTQKPLRVIHIDERKPSTKPLTKPMKGD